MIVSLLLLFMNWLSVASSCGVVLSLNVVQFYFNGSLDQIYFFSDLFHVSTCLCVRQLDSLSSFGMLVLCTRVYLVVYVTMKTEETCLKRHMTFFRFNIRKGDGKQVISNFRKEVQTKLTKGLLDMIILQYLDHEPMHGYQLITQIRKGLGVNLRPSSVYPVLRMLEKKGCVQSAWSMDAERPRRVFSLTNEGKIFLRFTENSLKFICKNMEADYKNQIQTTSKPFARLTC